MFIFQHPAADCTVGDLIRGEKLTLQGLMLHPSEVSYMEHTLLEQERAFPTHRLADAWTKMATWWLSCSESPQNVWLQQSPVSAGNHISSCVPAPIYIWPRAQQDIQDSPWEKEEELVHQIWAENQNSCLLLILFDIYETDKRQPVNKCSVI